MKPFGRRIQVRPEQAEGVIQTADRSLIERATVLAVGDGVSDRIRVGDTVTFTSFGVDSVDLQGERHYFLLEDDAFILATERHGVE